MLKINISRQNIYIMLISFFLLIFIFVFSFLFLIPEGKEYRQKRVALKKELKEYRKYKKYHDDILIKLKNLQSENRHIISSFSHIFNPDRFEKEYKKYFLSLNLSELKVDKDDGNFTIYEVNTTSSIKSPINFYQFLDAINKSDWIIGINFPINFTREQETIDSSFTMKVYSDTNR